MSKKHQNPTTFNQRYVHLHTVSFRNDGPLKHSSSNWSRFADTLGYFQAAANTPQSRKGVAQQISICRRSTRLNDLVWNVSHLHCCIALYNLIDTNAKMIPWNMRPDGNVRIIGLELPNTYFFYQYNDNNILYYR